MFEVEGLYYRKPLEVLKATFEEEGAKGFHTSPYKLFWQPDKDKPPERIIMELYTSDTMLQEHEKIRSQPCEADCNLETVVAAIMLWSNSTHLASFAHHLTYIPKLPDTIQDFHSFLLDNEFIDAWEHGTIIKFPDGVSCRVFPRFFMYAADYPKKILLACVKFLRRSPCPRCLVNKDKIDRSGNRADQQQQEQGIRVDDHHRRSMIECAREFIFKLGHSVVSTFIENLIGVMSMVPTQNAFSEKLSKFGFDFHSMLVPDFMHKFELGTWKATLTHLIWILHASRDDLIPRFNERYQMVPMFGHNTIRKFSSNVSDLTKLTARDFEDLLQCSMPVFEQLIPDHNSTILDLLFELSTWHAFGKLQMHTKTTLHHFDNCTTRLSKALHKFRSATCSKFDTHDLP
ncbi:hypothetical protein DFH29DRAFT_1006871 [Suillus ampliporus]|nr:hypothetical protein DFH29DRAFT_1006871 [Suillus ampliporus]